VNWSVTDILVNSSNIGTIMVAHKLGKERLDHYLRDFGFGATTGVGFPGEATGLLLDPEHWYVTSMGTVPIGNGLAVTALQMLQVYSAVANGGEWRPPSLLQATVDAEGRRHPVRPRPTRRVVSAATAAKLNLMLRDVVRTGTGTNAAIPGYTAAGKTGTARKPLEGARGYSGNYVASFVGFVPAEDPRLVAAVVLDEPTPIYGGQVAAPVFSRIMQYALRLQRIPPPAAPAAATPAVPPGAPPARALDEAPGADDAPASSSSTSSTTTTTKPGPRTTGAPKPGGTLSTGERRPAKKPATTSTTKPTKHKPATPSTTSTTKPVKKKPATTSTTSR
jgi:cell division protein FtsI (penicillin-binding protein 3)